MFRGPLAVMLTVYGEPDEASEGTLPRIKFVMASKDKK